MCERSSASTSPRAESGVALVALIAASTVALILIGAALPAWRYVVQREREEEFIYRGAYLARALHRYSLERGGQYPTWQQFTEWAKQPGKVRRSALENPLDPKGKWRTIIANTIRPEDQALPCGRRTLPGSGGAAGGEVIGPVIGVSTFSTDDSYVTLCSRTRYDEWTFVAVAAAQGTQPPGGAPAAGGVAPPTYQDYKSKYVGYSLPGVVSQRSAPKEDRRNRKPPPLTE
jgi:hypothetical protein